RWRSCARSPSSSTSRRQPGLGERALGRDLGHALLLLAERNLPFGIAVPGGMHGPGLRRREPRADARDQEGRANTFHDLELRWNAPWEATMAIGANNVFDHVGPVLYS